MYLCNTIVSLPRFPYAPSEDVFTVTAKERELESKQQVVTVKLNMKVPKAQQELVKPFLSSGQSWFHSEGTHPKSLNMQAWDPT